jgi:hypothetical protein
MPRFRTRSQEVEAVQLRNPLTISGASDGEGLDNPLDHPAVSASVGDWLLTRPDGNQEIVNDAEFSALYEEIPPAARRGRPPKSRGVAAVASTKRKRRRARARSKNGRKSDKAAA